MPASQNQAGDIELIGPILPVTRLVAKTGSAIAQGDLVHLNTTSDVWETCPTSGAGPFGVAAKAALSTDTLVEIWEGPNVYVYLKADAAIDKGNEVASGAVTAGRVGPWIDGTTAINRRVGKYILKGNVTPLQGDGVTFVTAAANNDLILILLYGS
jgi:hypothetical protein